MSPMLRDLHGVSFDTLRRLKGAFEVMLADARAIQREAATVREMVAAVSVVHQLEEAVSSCRDALQRKRREVGWRRSQQMRAEERASLPARGGNPDTDGTERQRRPGVSGAQPLTAMGHGWPASASRAGSAAPLPGRSEATPADSVKSARHPANPSFCPSNEGISNEINA